MLEDAFQTYATSKIGTLLDNTYELIDTIGSGSYGCLYLARQSSPSASNAYFAVKRLGKVGLDASELDLLRQECQLHARLHHPHIVQLHCVIETQEDLWMVMELCAGGDLFDILSGGREEVDDDYVRTAMVQVLSAVEHCHSQGVYHRDIKPENLLLFDDGSLKLADFGLATSEEFPGEYGVGSLQYIPPEQHEDAAGTEYHAAKGDIWALGVLMLAMLTGKNAWQQASPSRDPVFAAYVENPVAMIHEMFPWLTNECVALITSLLSVDPEKRPTIQAAIKRVQSISRFSSSNEEDQAADKQSVVDPATAAIPARSGMMAHSLVRGWDSGVAFSVSSAWSWSDMADEPEEMDFSKPVFDMAFEGKGERKMVEFERDREEDQGVFVCEC
ncbi:uncharacterized protein VTP21DRAFT_118 [Calcarisporiella thermophila]|uniref:uncharacterized protein n=1 Tax=Calcarisporiella thermophila TaxID=911321 RepID=UPI003744021F